MNIYIILLLISICSECSGTFKVSVVEYQEDYSSFDTPITYMSKNSEDFVNIISQVAHEGSCLVVFPENSFVYHNEFLYERNLLAAYAFRIPNPGMNINLCTLPEPNKYKKALVKISCAAKENQIFVVMNLLEIVNDYVLSTNIVFDDNGEIIAKCRKDLYTGKHIEHENCIFSASNYNYTFSILTENDLFSPDIKTLIADTKNVIYTTHRAINNTFLPNVPLYEMFRRKHNLDNLLVSARHDSMYGLTGSGIFTPWDSKFTQTDIRQKSEVLSYHLGYKPINKRKFRHTSNKLPISKYIKNMSEFTIKDLKMGENIYESNGLSCRITVNDETTSSYYRVAILNKNEDISIIPSSGKLDERTMHMKKFCGIIYCNQHTCGNVMKTVPETPKVIIEMITEEQYMTPIIVNSDLTYQEPNRQEVKQMECIDIDGYVFGFMEEKVFYEKIHVASAESRSTHELMRSGSNNFLGSLWLVSVLFFIFAAINAALN